MVTHSFNTYLLSDYSVPDLVHSGAELTLSVQRSFFREEFSYLRPEYYPTAKEVV